MMRASLMTTTGNRGRWLLVTLAAVLASATAAGAQEGPFDLPDDHFLCYRGSTARGDLALPTGLQVTLSDAFDTDRRYDVATPRGICNPTDKNGEGIVDPITRLTPYRITPVEGVPPHVPVTDIRVFNQFGSIVVDTVKEDRILLPAAMDAAGGPVVAPDGAAHDVDPFTCYTVRLAKGSPRVPRGLQIALEDQFQSPRRFDVKRPRLLCTPVDKNGDGIKKPDGRLLCYRARPAAGEPRHATRTGVSTADEFVIHKIDTRTEELLCVPSLTDPPAEFCGDGVVNQPPFEDCDGDVSACQAGEICTDQCTCVAGLGARTFSFDPATSSFLTSFLGQTPVATPAGTLVLDGGALDGSNAAPVSLINPPAYITVDINLGLPQTVCYQVVSCVGVVHCAGGANVDVLESLDSLATDQLGCIRNGTNSCPDVPSNVCCSNACEGALVGSGNLATVTTGVGATDSGPGALVMTCAMRNLQLLPIGSDCSTQDYSAQPIENHGLTTGTATSRVTRHCAGNGAAPDTIPTFQATGENLDCGSWSSENGPGTLVWALPTEEPTTFIRGDGANAFVFAD